MKYKGWQVRKIDYFDTLLSKHQNIKMMQQDMVYLSVHYGSKFRYKEGYYQISKRMAPNTWNFLICQNMKSPGTLCLKSELTPDMKWNGVRLTGQEPINYKKLRKMCWPIRPTVYNNLDKENIRPTNDGDDEIAALYLYLSAIPPNGCS